MNDLFLSPVELYTDVLTGKRKRFPAYYWEKPEALTAAAEITRYLCESILIWDDEQIKKYWKNDLIKKYKLNGMLGIVFNNSPFAVIDNAYPGRFIERDLPRTPKSYWNKETALSEFEKIIRRDLGLDYADITQIYGVKFLAQYRLNGAIEAFGGRIFEPIKLLFPSEFRYSDFKKVPPNFWKSKQERIESIRWLVVEHLHFNPNDSTVPIRVAPTDFKAMGLGGMLTAYYAGSAYRAIKEAFPKANISIYDINKRTLLEYETTE